MDIRKIINDKLTKDGTKIQHIINKSGLEQNMVYQYLKGPRNIGADKIGKLLDAAGLKIVSK